MADSASVDFHPRFTITRFGNFGRLFRSPDSEFERSIARLSVLYEDLYLEVVGAGMEKGIAPQLEPFGPAYRSCYFLRRAVATALEVKDVIDQILVTREFRRIEVEAKSSQDVHYKRDWVPAVEFFKENRKLLKTVRDDVGGHFGDGAAKKALTLVADDYCASIEIQSDVDGRVRLLLPFATELAASALLANVPGATVECQLQSLVLLLGKAVECTVDVVHFLGEAVLWKRLG
jgi:hypothetical protein